MILTTTDTVQGKNITQTLGLVKGNTVRAKWIGRDIAAGLKNLVGGEIQSYTMMLTDARNEAIQRMADEAEKLGADAVVGVRIATSQTMAGAAELLAYGTAVKLE